MEQEDKDSYMNYNTISEGTRTLARDFSTPAFNQRVMQVEPSMIFGI